MLSGFLMLIVFISKGINSNYGDSATISDMSQSDIDTVCQTYTGTEDGSEPDENDDNDGDCDGTYCIC